MEKPGRECLVAGKPKKGISRRREGYARGRPKMSSGVATGSHYNFDQRNFRKQKLEDRMHKVEEREMKR